jgi:hypothetical protein
MNWSFRLANVPVHPRRKAARERRGGVGRNRMLAGSSAQYHIDTVKDLRTRLRPKAPDPVGEK